MPSKICEKEVKLQLHVCGRVEICQTSEDMCILDASIFLPNKAMSHFTDGTINFPDQTNAKLMPSSPFYDIMQFSAAFLMKRPRGAPETLLCRDNKAKTIRVMTLCEL